jgi:hypothetical protein
MVFDQKEIEVILQQHVLDNWDVGEEALGSVDLKVKHGAKEGDHHVFAEVYVKTNDTDGGGPYRSRR